jgi:type IV pilus assembly protein PilP
MLRQWQKRQTSQRIFFTLALTALAAMHAGCSQSTTAPTPAAAPGASAQRRPIASAPTGTALLKTEQTPTVAFSYRPVNRRDPFAPIVMRQEKKASIGDRPPLERYNISEFKLSGIVWGGFGYNAMLEGPDGKGYFIRVGTILGPNRGVVKKITQNVIVIEEKFKNMMGEIERKEITVQLRKKQEEKP